MHARVCVCVCVQVYAPLYIFATNMHVLVLRKPNDQNIARVSYTHSSRRMCTFVNNVEALPPPGHFHTLYSYSQTFSARINSTVLFTCTLYSYKKFQV